MDRNLTTKNHVNHVLVITLFCNVEYDVDGDIPYWLLQLYSSQDLWLVSRLPMLMQWNYLHIEGCSYFPVSSLFQFSDCGPRTPSTPPGCAHASINLSNGSKTQVHCCAIMSLGQLTSHPLNWPSFGKGENKSQLIDIVSQSHQTMFKYILIRHCNPSRSRNIKIERSKQLYHNNTLPLFSPLPKLGQWMWRQLTERITVCVNVCYFWVVSSHLLLCFIVSVIGTPTSVPVAS